MKEMCSLPSTISSSCRPIRSGIGQFASSSLHHDHGRAQVRPQGKAGFLDLRQCLSSKMVPFSVKLLRSSSQASIAAHPVIHTDAGKSGGEFWIARPFASKDLKTNASAAREGCVCEKEKGLCGLWAWLREDTELDGTSSI